MTGDVAQPGVTPRAVRELFAVIEHATRTKDAVFLVHVSYVELYNNQFRNLLDDVGTFAISRAVPKLRSASHVTRVSFLRAQPTSRSP